MKVVHTGRLTGICYTKDYRNYLCPKTSNFQNNRLARFSVRRTGIRGGAEMSEIQTLKEDIAEIKETIKEVAATVNDMRVFLAGNFITRIEFDKYKEEEKTGRRWWAGFIITAASLIMGIVTIMTHFWS